MALRGRTVHGHLVVGIRARARVERERGRVGVAAGGLHLLVDRPAPGPPRGGGIDGLRDQEPLQRCAGDVEGRRITAERVLRVPVQGDRVRHPAARAARVVGRIDGRVVGGDASLGLAVRVLPADGPIELGGRGAERIRLGRGGARHPVGRRRVGHDRVRAVRLLGQRGDVRAGDRLALGHGERRLVGRSALRCARPGEAHVGERLVEDAGGIERRAVEDGDHARDLQRSRPRCRSG